MLQSINNSPTLQFKAIKISRPLTDTAISDTIFEITRSKEFPDKIKMFRRAHNRQVDYIFFGNDNQSENILHELFQEKGLSSSVTSRFINIADRDIADLTGLTIGELRMLKIYKKDAGFFRLRKNISKAFQRW